MEFCKNIPPRNEPMACSVDVAAKLAGCSRTTIYEAIKSGDLQVHKMGARTIIIDEDLRSWLRSLPTKEVA